jgi:hypothetical protein
VAEPAIALAREGAVAEIVLANPPLNLFTDTAFEELMACLDEAEGSDARAWSGGPTASSSPAGSTSMLSSAWSRPGRGRRRASPGP